MDALVLVLVMRGWLGVGWGLFVLFYMDYCERERERGKCAADGEDVIRSWYKDGY